MKVDYPYQQQQSQNGWATPSYTGATGGFSPSQQSQSSSPGSPGSSSGYSMMDQSTMLVTPAKTEPCTSDQGTTPYFTCPQPQQPQVTPVPQLQGTPMYGATNPHVYNNNFYGIYFTSPGQYQVNLKMSMTNHGYSGTGMPAGNYGWMTGGGGSPSHF